MCIFQFAVEVYSPYKAGNTANYSNNRQFETEYHLIT